jgi:hypothetical protein
MEIRSTSSFCDLQGRVRLSVCPSVLQGRGQGRAGPTGDFTVAFGHGHPLVQYIKDVCCVSKKFRCYQLPKQPNLLIKKGR